MEWTRRRHTAELKPRAAGAALANDARVPDLSGPMPAYYQIAQILKLRIASSVYSPKSLFPTDEQLMREFSVGRHTVRTAVLDLVNEGLVSRFPGRGTFVQEKRDVSEEWSLRSLEDVLDSRYSDDAEVLSSDEVTAEKEPEAAMALRIEPKQSLWRLVMARSREDKRGLVSVVFLPQGYGRALPDNLAQHLRSHKLITLVERYNGVRAARVRQRTTAILADKWVSEMLHVKPSSAILLLNRTYFDSVNHPLQTADLFCNPESYRMTVDFHRSKV